jgi:hypothetical protein
MMIALLKASEVLTKSPPVIKPCKKISRFESLVGNLIPFLYRLGSE